MSVSGFENFVALGSELYFTPDAINGVVQPARSIGTLKSCEPTVTEDVLELWEGKSGELELLTERRRERTEIWEAVTQDMNLDNIALVMGADPPETVTQSGTTKTLQLHYGHPGYLLNLREGGTDTGDTDTIHNGERALYVASIGAIRKESNEAALVEGVDWEWVDKQQGQIRLLVGNSGGILVAGTPLLLEITFTYTAATMKKIKVGQGRDNVGGYVEIWLCDNDNETQYKRSFRSFMSRGGMSLGVEDFNSITLSFAVAADRTLPNRLGEFTRVTGDEPSLS